MNFQNNPQKNFFKNVIHEDLKDFIKSTKEAKPGDIIGFEMNIKTLPDSSEDIIINPVTTFILKNKDNEIDYAEWKDLPNSLKSDGAYISMILNYNNIQYYTEINNEIDELRFFDDEFPVDMTLRFLSHTGDIYVTYSEELRDEYSHVFIDDQKTNHEIMALTGVIESELQLLGWNRKKN